MSTEKLLQLIHAYLLETNQKEIHTLKKEFAYALNEYIDFRVQAILHPQTIQTSNRKVIMQSSHDIIDLVEVLNSAPPPPDITKFVKHSADFTDQVNLNIWLQSYIDWYEECKSALAFHTYTRDSDPNGLK